MTVRDLLQDAITTDTTEVTPLQQQLLLLKTLVLDDIVIQGTVPKTKTNVTREDEERNDTKGIVLLIHPMMILLPDVEEDEDIE
eukprot:CAMPEP_0202450104 /NCGR_PEP_ID=MMETSP1360-20130828/8750_1 /ASSEMBLY_ACC=CAM_ASM_000848 /TAXON_ID=515479 /ORGANISM="Licmophora paradoxa, Strain CCMP2313" /LENGTH=83 /DNA_ID=CAMNT_0049068245 /DNA_START=14 /DNA_END=265 /DNA_ORIENTATION=+